MSKSKEQTIQPSESIMSSVIPTGALGFADAVDQLANAGMTAEGLYTWEVAINLGKGTATPEQTAWARRQIETSSEPPIKR